MSESLPVRIKQSSCKSNLIPVNTGKGLRIETALVALARAFNNLSRFILKLINFLLVTNYI